MEESLGAQYAIQIAVHTLRDRCKSLQQRITLLEEENVDLRMKCTRSEEAEQHSLSEMDKLRVQITEVSENRDQLQEKVKMVSGENQDLWNKLGKLMNLNKNLREQLGKINQTVNQHLAPTHTNLIRSKTFTQMDPQMKLSPKNLDINEKISLELENISLKLSDSFSKQKMELEKMCSEIEDVQYNEAVVTESFGFYFDDQLEEDLFEELKYILEDLKLLKGEVLMQKETLKTALMYLDNLQSREILSCKSCDTKKNLRNDKSTSTSDIKLGVDKCIEANLLIEERTPSKQTQPMEFEMICPICTRQFIKDVEFTEFQRHVESHFTPEVSSYQLL
nr:protein spindle-F [Leptinotarsa decemlineata]